MGNKGPQKFNKRVLKRYLLSKIDHDFQKFDTKVEEKILNIFLSEHFAVRHLFMRTRAAFRGI